jgi:hypothetical protein
MQQLQKYTETAECTATAEIYGNYRIYSNCKIYSNCRIYSNYRNTKLQLLKTNVAIRYNKICKAKQLTPKYCSVKIKANSRQNRNTRIAAAKCRLKVVHVIQCREQLL